ncbi:MAG TPA: AAA family ATPase, partial [Candidatus Acidoferrales bacterium]|nr:AAA family ATPase [Candidatus Acidoferrales bacterium]
MIHIFGQFELDAALCELRSSGRPVKTEPQVFRLLAYLIAHRDRVVTRDELFEQLWPGEFVSDAALSYCIAAARKAVRDDGQRQRIIETIPRRGFRFLPDVRVKGPVSSQSNPQRSFLDRATVPPNDLQARGFVGRTAELQALNEGLDAALNGNGRVFLLVGEPGIGKTRTTDVFAAHAQARGAQVLVGRCHERDGAPAFWPWTQMLRAYTQPPEIAKRRRAAGMVATVQQLSPEVSQLLGTMPPAVDGESPYARFHLFEGVTRFLREAATLRPLMLVLDDLHWADKPSLLLLEFLARELGTARLLVVATYRDTDVRPGQPLADSLGALARIDACQRLPLGGLSETDVASFIEQASGEQPQPSLVHTVHQGTEGNPFFLSEVVRLL